MSKRREKIDNEQHLAQMRARLDLAVTNESDERKKGTEDIKFINGDQWEAKVIADRKDRLNLTINKMPTYLDQIDGDIRQHKPGIKVKAVDNVDDKDSADVIEGLIRSIERNSGASRIYAYAGLHLTAGGRGAWRYLTDYVNDTSFDQNIKVMRIPNAYSVYYDPAAKQEDKQDGQFMFIVDDMSKEVYKDTYGNDPVDFSVDGTEYANWQNEGNVRVAEYFYKKKVSDRTLYLLEDGTTTYELGKGDQVKDQRSAPKYEIWWEKVDGKRILEGPRKVVGNMFPIVLVWGKQLFVDGKIDVRGIARHSKDAQRLYNYFSSNDAETTALQPKQPYLMPDVCLGPYKTSWDNAVDENYPYLPYVVDPNNPSLRPIREAPAMPSGGNAMQLQRADQDLRDTTGIQKAALGMQSNEKSGIAIRERKTETDTGQYAFVDNLSAGVRTGGQIMLGMIPEVYDTARMIRILGPDFKEKVVKINQQGGIDITTGMYDVDIDVGPSFSTQREEFVDKISAILPSIPPEQAAMITDILFESMDFPRSDDIAERLKKLLPPGLLGDAETPEGGSPLPGGPPPAYGQPPSPPPDPMMEMQAQAAQAQSQMDLQLAQIKLAQEQAKLEGIQIENQSKKMLAKENLRGIIEELMNEGREVNATV